jgi:hypothetical protein
MISCNACSPGTRRLPATLDSVSSGAAKPASTRLARTKRVHLSGCASQAQLGLGQAAASCCRRRRSALDVLLHQHGQLLHFVARFHDARAGGADLAHTHISVDTRARRCRARATLAAAHRSSAQRHFAQRGQQREQHEPEQAPKRCKKNGQSHCQPCGQPDGYRLRPAACERQQSERTPTRRRATPRAPPRLRRERLRLTA